MILGMHARRPDGSGRATSERRHRRAAWMAGDRGAWAGRAAFGGSVLAVTLTWLMVSGIEVPADVDIEVRRSIDAVGLAEAQLHYEVLRARGGLVRGDGLLTMRIMSLRASLAAVEAARPHGTRELRAVAVAVADEIQAAERFRADNAPVQAALAYFDALGERMTSLDPRLVPLLEVLPSEAGALARGPTRPRLHAFRRRMRQLVLPNQDLSGGDREIESVRRHGRALVELLPSVDALGRALPTASSESQRDALIAAHLAGRAARQALAIRDRLALSLAALALLALLALQVRAGARNLTRMVQFQHAIAQACNRFLAAQPEEATSRIEEVLAIIGEAAGLDHGYVLSLEPDEKAHLWSRSGLPEPSGWPCAQRAMIPDILAWPHDRIAIEVRNGGAPGALRDQLAARGVVSWGCARLRRGDQVVGLLCYERSTGPLQPWLRRSGGMLQVVGSVFSAALERQHTAERHRETEAALRRAQRLETIGIFASGVAHNINNVLNVILGHAEIAAEALAPGTRAARQIDLLIQAGGRAREITGQILDFGRRGTSSWHANSLDVVVAETLAQIRSSMAEPVTIRLEGTTGGALVRGEAAQLQQVVHNLIRNAAQASDPGAVVGVHMAAVGVKGVRRLSHGTLRPGPYARLCVFDAGRGMDEATRARIFEPFFTTRPTGTGLGLATAFAFVEERGGAFDVRSTPGEGSTFEVWLPVVAPPEAGPSVAPTGGTLMLVGHSRAGILEDEEMLAALGFEPSGFVDPEAALAALRAAPGRFDLILVESQLAAAPDLAFARQASRLVACPIVLSVAAVEFVDGKTLAAAGVAGVVRRPYSPNALVAVLSRYLGAVGDVPLTEIGRSRLERSGSRHRFPAARHG